MGVRELLSLDEELMGRRKEKVRKRDKRESKAVLGVRGRVVAVGRVVTTTCGGSGGVAPAVESSCFVTLEHEEGGLLEGGSAEDTGVSRTSSPRLTLLLERDSLRWRRFFCAGDGSGDCGYEAVDRVRTRAPAVRVLPG